MSEAVPPAAPHRPQAEALLSGLFRLMEYPARLDFKDMPDGALGVAVHFEGDLPGVQPGKRSYLVDCIQFLVNKAVNRPHVPRRWINLGVDGFPEPKGQRAPGGGAPTSQEAASRDDGDRAGSEASVRGYREAPAEASVRGAREAPGAQPAAPRVAGSERDSREAEARIDGGDLVAREAAPRSDGGRRGSRETAPRGEGGGRRGDREAAPRGEGTAPGAREGEPRSQARHPRQAPPPDPAPAIPDDPNWTRLGRSLAETAARLGRVYGVMLLSADDRVRLQRAAEGVAGVHVKVEGDGHWRRVVLTPPTVTPLVKKHVMPDWDDEEA
jgi:hypothetical protein